MYLDMGVLHTYILIFDLGGHNIMQHNCLPSVSANIVTGCVFCLVLVSRGRYRFMKSFPLKQKCNLLSYLW